LSTSATTKSILVTGADGFIGHHLVEELRKRNRPVVAATRQQKTIAGEKTIAVGDIDGNTNWRGAFESCSHVVHLAGRAHALTETQADPATAFERVNSMGTAALARQAAEMGARRLLFLSTIAVYDPLLTHLGDDTPAAPQTDYGRSKLAGEQSLRDISNTKMSHTILRVPLVYGPGVGARFLQLLNLARLPLPLPLAGINNQRSLVFVGNLVDLIIHALDHPEAENRTFLVSDGEEISTPNLVKSIATGMGQLVPMWPMPKPVLDLGTSLMGRRDQWQKLTGTLVVDSQLVQRELSWAPPFSLDQGLRETAAWFKNNR